MMVYDDIIEEAAKQEDELDDEEEEKIRHPGVKERLMEEASSVEHQITHFPKNPYCMSCQLGKIHQVKGKLKGSSHFGPRPEQFGDQVTADHIVKTNEYHFGSGDERVALVIADRATGFLGGYPSESKTGEQTEMAFKHFQ